MNLHDIAKKLGSSLEARMLLRHVTGLSDAEFITKDVIPLTHSQKIQLEECIAQRLQKKPIAKIIGEKEFYGLSFLTSEDVLDPRPDSETLIDVVLKHTKNKNHPYKILELGTGSGCLILTLLSELPYAQAVATDISECALTIATNNATRIGVTDRVKFLISDWFKSVRGEFDIIISNPPYIESKDIQNLDADVRNYDPLLALDGGEDGLDPYKVILPQIRTYLKNDGFVALEHGSGQGSRINEIAEKYGFVDTQTHHDLSGHDRILSIFHK